MPEKICRICNKQKPEYLFGRAKGNTSGISNRCKECDILYQKDYRKQNKDKGILVCANCRRTIHIKEQYGQI